MQVNEQVFLDLVEAKHSICFFDIEATGLRGDYNSILCTSIKPYGKTPITFTVKQPGNDQKLVREVKEALETFDCWVGYYSKGYDRLMLDTRLLKWEMTPIAKRPHIDMYYTLKYNILTSRRSQGHLLGWLETPQEKMSVSADVWNGIVRDIDKHMPTMVKRCESDTKGLEALYKKTRHLIRDIKNG